MPLKSTEGKEREREGEREGGMGGRIKVFFLLKETSKQTDRQTSVSHENREGQKFVV